MKMSKKLLSLLLCAIMVLGSAAIGGGGFAEVLDAFSVKASAASYSDGTGSNDGWADSTHIRFGSYPQSMVTDSFLISTLNSVGGTWKSYGYYSGTDVWYDGQMSSANYMMYCDVTVMNGSVSEKYRGVKFSTYRPSCTGFQSTTSADYTNQDDNGYTYGKTYWFKYEPLVWRVLDSSTGLVMCESIIDSQAYNNYIWYGVGSKSTSNEYYGNEAHTDYANDYYNSSIREWLTEDFYATAFSKSQQKNLLKYNCDNSCYSSSYPEYDSQNSSDKVFLLSYDEVKNTEYGFNSDEDEYDSARRAKGTDYAKCQGLNVCNDGSEYDGNSWWWLRSPDDYSYNACEVRNDGYSNSSYDVDSTGNGVRPALKLDLTSDIFQSDVTDTGTAAASGTGSNDGWADSTHIRFGSYPQTDVTASMGNTLDAKATDWKSYKYYEGNGSYGTMHESDYMMYCDVTVMNRSVPEKYRGVKFSTYRPCWTGHASTTSAVTQQDDNGYTVGNTYWFKYEPLVWRVLDSSTGLVMCESIIDSQAYNNYIWRGTGSKSTSSEYYGNEAHTNYANDYYNSSIRKWLTEDFYATAFSESQQNKLIKYNCDNSCYSSSYPEYNSQNSSDKVFLLSYDEVKTAAYGFNSSASNYNIARRAKGTDYAKCQGLWVSKSSESEYNGNSRWLLRSPDLSSCYACGVNDYGGSINDYYVDYTDFGVRPALKLNLLEIMKDEAKAELAEAKMNAVSDEAKAAIDTAIENVNKATDSDAVASAKAEGTSNAVNADKALADAKAAAKTDLAAVKNNAVSDEAKAAIDTAIENVDKATNLDAVASAKAEGTRNAENADNAYAEKIKFDNVNIKVAGAQTVDYRSIVTITATAENVPDDCKLAIYLGSQKVAEGDNKSVSYEYGEIKSDINYTVKVIDANGKVQKDSNGNELTKDGGKITMKKTFFGMIIAFFKSLFKSLPKVEVKP